VSPLHAPNNCMSCGGLMYYGESGDAMGYGCQKCGRFDEYTPKAPATPQEPVEPAWSGPEKLLVAAIGHRLGEEYIMICVGQRKAKNSGTTEGCPDLFISKRGRNLHMAFETKTFTGRPSKKQQEFVDAGVSEIARNVEIVVQRVKEELG